MTPTQVHEFLLGGSAAIQKVRALIELVAPTDLPVLIAGPTGSGKELVARSIHVSSGRSGKLVSFNVCAIAESMFEDALFGHVRGAFTGAQNSAPGFLREAHGGTAFLDEIGGLGANVQAKLLRAIETQEFRPVGAPADVRSDFRLIAAANEDIWNLEQIGRFRGDLAHRLSAFVIRVPPLREHTEDIPVLALAFLNQSVGDSRGAIGKDSMQLLMKYEWPGNVRELRQVVRSAVTLGGSGKLRPEDIREILSWRTPLSPRLPERSLADRRLMEVLAECAGDTEEAARQLNVHRATIYRRLKRVGIERDTPDSIGSPESRMSATPMEEPKSA